MLSFLVLLLGVVGSAALVGVALVAVSAVEAKRLPL